jgi:hypothetical protein
MSAYALAHMREIGPHPEVLEYLERIQTTLDPFSGRFIVHGGAIEVREGTWPGNLVIIDSRRWRRPATSMTRLRTGRSCHCGHDTSRRTRSSLTASSQVMTRQTWRPSSGRLVGCSRPLVKQYGHQRPISPS